jgi:Aspartyl protease/Tetratricopeptide repeat
VKTHKLALALVYLLALTGSAIADAPEVRNLARTAGTLFREGKFAEAEALYAKVQALQPDDFDGTLGLGTIALLKNDLAAAERWLTKATTSKPEDTMAKRRLALVYYRRDDFAKAAPLYRALGQEAVAKKLESFQGLPPYKIEGAADESRIPFTQTDPLPIIQVKVNSEQVYFLIDTGASEVYINPELAKKAGATLFGNTPGTYGGGLKADTGHGRVDQLELGDFVIHNVPVNVLNTRRFDAVARGKHVDGVLGTVMFAHFLATIDYPHGQLILRRKTKDLLRQVEDQAQAAKGIVVPFWLAGEHFMVARGQINHGKPLLFFADTGLAGGGFACPKATIQEAAIRLPQGAAVVGQGGGGKVRAVPFKVEELSFGAATEWDVQAFAGVFPEAIEYSESFRIGGIVSHQFFRPYALTLDFTGMRFFLVREKKS